jgi:outer membrane protein TolC
MHKSFLFLLIGLLVNGPLSAQEPGENPSALSLEEFLRSVAAYHPAARNADLVIQQAEANLRMAKGAFDPKAYGIWDQKSFDGKNYFSVGSAGIKVQSAFGVSVKSEFNLARGQFLNPENNLPAEGQAVLGINVPLLNGLLFDPFRAELQQARLGLQGGAAQRRSQLNDFLFGAGLAYLDWALAHYQVQIFQQAADVAAQRLKIVAESFIQGDKPAIDTLETYIQLQNRSFDLNEALLERANARQTLETFFWEQGKPVWTNALNVLIPEPLPLPPSNQNPVLEQYLLDLAKRHPDLQDLAVELQILNVDRRIAAEQFKPRLDFSYNILSTGTDFLPILTGNYKWGLNFSFPLFLRKEQGKMENVRLKQIITGNKFDRKLAEQEAKIRNYFNELQTTQQQIALYTEVARNYAQLFEAEQIKFDLGESSVFLLNTREQKLLEARLKLIKLQAILRKNLLALSWASGQLI